MKYPWKRFDCAIAKCFISKSNLKDMMKVRFIIDPGATNTFMSEETLTELGFKITGDLAEGKTRLANGEYINTSIMEIPVIAFGGRQFNRIGVRTCKGSRGVNLLGMDILSHFRFSFELDSVDFEYMYDGVGSPMSNKVNVFNLHNRCK